MLSVHCVHQIERFDQKPRARQRPRQLIENTILKNDESVEDANEDVGASTS
jgi:hypothetical protein